MLLNVEIEGDESEEVDIDLFPIDGSSLDSNPGLDSNSSLNPLSLTTITFTDHLLHDYIGQIDNDSTIVKDVNFLPKSMMRLKFYTDIHRDDNKDQKHKHEGTILPELRLPEAHHHEEDPYKFKFLDTNNRHPSMCILPKQLFVHGEKQQQQQQQSQRFGGRPDAIAPLHIDTHTVHKTALPPTTKGIN